MTYQSFANVEGLKQPDPGLTREFKIIIPKGKYITQGDIHFKIEYTNINYEKIENICASYLTKSKSIGFEKMNVENLKEYKTKINELIDSTIETIEQEYKDAPSRQTPLFMFQNIELFVDERSVARRMFSSLDDLITNNHLYLNQIFPGIKFKYDSSHELLIRFTRGVIENKCLKFECHYNVSDIPEEDMSFGLIAGYKEYILPGSLYCANIEIEPDVKSFKMVPLINHHLFKFVDNKDYKSESERIINECYNNLKLKYYKDGLEISESEFGTSPGLYHIEPLNRDELSKNKNFCDVDYKIICEC